MNNNTDRMYSGLCVIVDQFSSQKTIDKPDNKVIMLKTQLLARWIDISS